MKAFITGITGQDGAYLSRLLLEKGYDVHGLVRRKADTNLWRLREFGIHQDITLHTGDMICMPSLVKIIKEVQPDEIYNLAAQSFVAASFETPISTFEINAIGTLNLLESVRLFGKEDIHFYQASTSEMFGLTTPEAQNETTPFHPRSPYGVSKLAAHWQVINYRETYGMFGCTGILFNHESPYRGIEFVTRKVTDGVARIIAGLETTLNLGNIDTIRDWGSAEDYVQAMWLMMQHSIPDDFVIATGESHTVREMCDLAFSSVGLNYQKYVVIDEKLYRPCEVPVLKGDAIKARNILGWKPRYSFEELIGGMLDEDLARYNIKRPYQKGALT